MTVITTSHIILDNRRVAFIEGTQTRVAQVVLGKMSGLEAEQIHKYQTELDAQIQKDQAKVDEARQAAVRGGAQPTKAQLEARLRGGGEVK